MKAASWEPQGLHRYAPLNLRLFLSEVSREAQVHKARSNMSARLSIDEQRLAAVREAAAAHDLSFSIGRHWHRGALKKGRVLVQVIVTAKGEQQ